MPAAINPDSESVERTGVGEYVIHSYAGKLLDDMSREELVEAVKTLGRENERLYGQLKADSDRWQASLKNPKAST